MRGDMVTLNVEVVGFTEVTKRSILEGLKSGAGFPAPLLFEHEGMSPNVRCHENPHNC